MPEDIIQNIAKGEEVGVITHYFGKIQVAVVKATDTIKTGDVLVISGHGNEFEQRVDSLQIEHEKVQQITKGQEAGMKVAMPTKEGAKVYKKRS